MRAAVLAAALALACVASTAAQSLKADIDSFRNNDPVTVTINNPKPGTNDVVALYFAGAQPDNVKPLKYKWTSTISHYMKTGTGTLSFNLLNQRENVRFLLLSNVSASAGFVAANVIAKSSVIKNAEPNAPEHGHLSRTADISEMLVQWTTRDVGMPIAKFGTSATSLTRSVAAKSKTYTKADMCGPPASADGWVDPGTLHVATLTGLLPDTVYYYKYGQEGSMSPVYSFRTAPPTGAASTVKWLAVADLGHTEIDGSDEYDYDPSGDTLNLIPDYVPEQVVETIHELIVDNAYSQSGSTKTREAIYQDIQESPHDYSLFLLNGDVSYARGMQTQWDVFMHQMVNVTTSVPIQLVDGNHERDFNNSGDRFNNNTYAGNYDSGGECGIPYEMRYQRIPAPGPQKVAGGYLKRDGAPGAFKGVDVTPLWYSYDHGPIHYLAYSTELDFYPGSPQYKFMEADLAAVNRTNTPWVVLNGHRPIYTTNTGGASPYGVINVARDLREALEPLLFEYQVDLTLHGHDHIYERTCPIYNHTCINYNDDGSAKGPVHVVIGNSGYELSWFYNPMAPAYWESIAIEHGYLRCETSATKLVCQMISSMTGNMLDEIILTKPAGWKSDPARQAAFIKGFNGSYVPATTLETVGIPGGPYGDIIKPLLMDLGEDGALLAEVIHQNQLHNRTVDHAIEDPDTVIDDCELLKIAIKIIENDVIQNPETPSTAVNTALTSILPQYKAVCAAAGNYAKGGGVVRPYGAIVGKPTPLSKAFANAQPRPAAVTVAPTAAPNAR